jgi:hypothetical protein
MITIPKRTCVLFRLIILLHTFRPDKIPQNGRRAMDTRVAFRLNITKSRSPLFRFFQIENTGIKKIKASEILYET